ncbi:hypothetical protein [Frankia sp. QA3]|uniref:hypothetical protein n=1 Tax=Frankia sp. QA3 TaxID=710111 RepID=UPI000269C5E4|nr:hypothetical protein [Frankia sp. QA3]EIV93542.1 hypothetical protein FraQA3DRAFT_3246 [Frankia sp. QA3]
MIRELGNGVLQTGEDVNRRTAYFASDDQWRGQFGRWVRGHSVSRQLRLEPFDDAQIRRFLLHRFRRRAGDGQGPRRS